MRAPHRAFTLLETLLVVGIIAVVGAIVFAAVGPAREQGRIRVCNSNLHQIGRAFQMYIADYDGVDPVVGVAMDCPTLGLPSGQQPIMKFPDTYVREKAVLLCPSYHGEIPVSRRGSTYDWPLMSCVTSPDRMRAAVAEQGPRLALVVCDQHNGDIDFIHQPHWATKQVQVLRINGQVEMRRIKALDFGENLW